jgi:hypothetical protein
MKSTRTRTTRLAFITALAAPCIIFGAAHAAQSQDSKPQTAAQKFKNIKVLKDVPADKLVPIMHQWNMSLGVKCDFCHDIETTASGQHVGWEKDTKPTKNMARKMATMTQKMYLSDRLLKGKASCFMCHHGKPEPDINAPAEAPRGAAK